MTTRPNDDDDRSLVDALLDRIREIDGLVAETRIGDFEAEGMLGADILDLIRQIEARTYEDAYERILGDLAFYFPEGEPQAVRLGDDCTVQVDECGDLVCENGEMSGSEFFEHVEDGIWKLREHWKKTRALAEVAKDGAR